MQQQGVKCNFADSIPWVILSPIEQSIRRKIESIGTPLKDWDINIYRGVLTGYNDAFIISTEKRDEILANCQTEGERVRTAELIRPILRGRDIKRYGYDWAGQWLIYIPWHFPYQFDESITGASEKAEKAFKEQYPAVYNHMLEYKEPLSKRNKAETGIRYEWYAMQRWGAKYWEDFSKPKIVWKIIGNQMAFAYDTNNYVMNNACYIMTGNHLDYLLAVLNSQAITWYSYVTNMNKTGVGDVQVGGQNIATFPMPPYDANKIELVELAELANSITNKNINLPFIDSKIESLVSMVYGFTSEETNFLHSFVSSLRKSI